MDRTSEFLRGISSGVGRGSGNAMDFFVFLLVVGLIIFLLWLINDIYKKYFKADISISNPAG